MNLNRLPAVIKSRIPTIPHVQNYEAAKIALAQCAQVDEVLKISAIAEAAASYAKQIGDDSLFENAHRIRRRAERRLGELLEQLSESARSKLSIKPHAQSRSISLAQIPEAKFEQKVSRSPVPSSAQMILEHRKETGTYNPRGERVGISGGADVAASLAEDIADISRKLKECLESAKRKDLFGVGAFNRWYVMSEWKAPSEFRKLAKTSIEIAEILETMIQHNGRL